MSSLNDPGIVAGPSDLSSTNDAGKCKDPLNTRSRVPEKDGKTRSDRACAVRRDPGKAIADPSE
jgi:hypothetical protein